jgi:hypothetical protein
VPTTLRSLTVPEPQWHVGLLPVVYGVSKSIHIERPVLASVVSVAIDVDHFTDVAYFRLTGCRDRQFVPFHSWEFAVAGVMSRNRTVRAASTGALAHLVADWLVGGYKFSQLSLAYRVAHRFRTGRMGPWVEWPRGQRGWKEIFYSRDVRSRTETDDSGLDTFAQPVRELLVEPDAVVGIDVEPVVGMTLDGGKGEGAAANGQRTKNVL